MTVPIEHLWVLKRGGIAFVLTAARSSPVCEAHLMEGRVIGEGPWHILDAAGQEIGRVFPDDRHIRDPLPRSTALEYLLGWHQRLRASDLKS